MVSKLKKKFSFIKNLVTDVDGVFTDGKFYYSDSGKVLKKFGPHDSDGLRLLKLAGIRIYAISADERGFKITSTRMADLSITLELVNERHRLQWFLNKFDPKETIFVGDGIYDAPLLKRAAYGFCPNNGVKEAKDASNEILPCSGGEGVFLEIARSLLNIKFD